MRVINNEKVTFHDVDGTLIMHSQLMTRTGRYISVLDPITGKYLEMQAHEPNIRLLLEEKHRGSYVIVWSRGGYEWAENVLKALNITDKVDLVLTKPMAYFDDVPINEWLPYRVWLDPNEQYKK